MRTLFRIPTPFSRIAASLLLVGLVLARGVVPAGAAPALVGAGSPGVTLGPLHPTVVVPITIARTDTLPLKGCSVTLQLSPLLVASGGAAGLTEGPFLATAGATDFHVIDNGAGSWTLDCAVLGPACGPTQAAGTLFNLLLAANALAGTGTVTVTSVLLRDCANGALDVLPGAVALVPIDFVPPTPLVLAPNGGETALVGVPLDLTWNATDNVGVTCVDLRLSRTGAAGPYAALATCVPNSGLFSWLVAGAATNHAVLKVVAHDAAGNSGADVGDGEFRIIEFVVPVRLVRFAAEATDDGVELRWTLTDAAGLVRTGVERGDTPTGPFTPVAGAVETRDDAWFQRDPDVFPGQALYYRVTGLTRAGEFLAFAPLAVVAGRPVTSPLLRLVTPTPARDDVAIEWTLPRATPVRLALFDTAGRLVVTLAEGFLPAGRHEARWNGLGARGPAPAGVYFVALDTPALRLTRRLVRLH